MNGKTPLYIGFALLLLGFLILFNAHKNLQAEIAETHNQIEELKAQLEQQSRPCQPEDLKFPKKSPGCTIPAKKPTSTTSTPNSPTVSTSVITPPQSTQTNKPKPPDKPDEPEQPEEPRRNAIERGLDRAADIIMGLL